MFDTVRPSPSSVPLNALVSAPPDRSPLPRGTHFVSEPPYAACRLMSAVSFALAAFHFTPPDGVASEPCSFAM